MENGQAQYQFDHVFPEEASQEEALRVSCCVCVHVCSVDAGQLAVFSVLRGASKLPPYLMSVCVGVQQSML